MDLADEALLDRIEAAVAAAEARTAAEFVVVLVPRSGRYPDRAQLLGFAAALLVLVGAIASPWVHSPAGTVLEVALTFFLVTAATTRTPGLLRLLVPAARKHRAVAVAARAAFFDEGVTGTRDRTGVLLFYSDLEERLEILADAGVLGAVGEAPLHEVAHRFHSLEGPPDLGARLAAALQGLGAALRTHLPRAEDDVDELPDRPRVRGDG